MGAWDKVCCLETTPAGVGAYYPGRILLAIIPLKIVPGLDIPYDDMIRRGHVNEAGCGSGEYGGNLFHDGSSKSSNMISRGESFKRHLPCYGNQNISGSMRVETFIPGNACDHNDGSGPKGASDP